MSQTVARIDGKRLTWSELLEEQMALNLSESNHRVLDEYLNILDAYKSGEMDQLTARSELAHTITAAAIDNHGLMAHIKAVLQQEDD